MVDFPSAAHAVQLADYRPPAWMVPTVDLRFELDAERTLVHARLTLARNPAGEGGALLLDGDELEPLAITLDGVPVPLERYQRALKRLRLEPAGDAAVLETVVALGPSANLKLMGLYASGGNLCTQCEAEGFRRITFFPDRPDVLSVYRVRIEADAARYPVLLGNGNPIAAGPLAAGRHFAMWDDPFPKPCYLFALVAGDLTALRDSFTTMSGRRVALAIWAAAADIARCAFAMAALKRAMAWDERVYGREYDLDMFNIVAVADFNFGAMENKGLNIFNAKYILADADTATDADFDAIAAVVAHEYFHNWSGNRVTCRDWFQLALKEGLTVYRDQQFCADEGSPAVRRIEDVRTLRGVQFPEDAGPLAHPVRPTSYLEISNFYTPTIYNKGAEIIRMIAGLIGAARFRRACDLYFDRHDGEAATIEDFVRAVEDGADIDLTDFRRWYALIGTPRLRARVEWDHPRSRGTVTLTQTGPAASARPLPVRLALIGGDSGRRLGDEQLVLVGGEPVAVTLGGVVEPPLLSINRGFSVPAIIETQVDTASLAKLARFDDDPFARYEALQQLMLRQLLAVVVDPARVPDHAPLLAALDATLAAAATDAAYVAEAVLVPSEAMIGDHLTVVDVAAVHAARDGLRRAVAAALGERLWAVWQASADPDYAFTGTAKGRRRLRAVVLGLLLADDGPRARAAALALFDDAHNMTDRMNAMVALSHSDGPERDVVLARFQARYAHDATLIDKWFSVQAMSTRADTLVHVATLAGRPDFQIANPNRLRALVGGFAANQPHFHDGGGAGYRFVADQVLGVDPLNPQSAAKLAAPLGRWRRFAPDRATRMRAELERIAATPGLSKDVFEIVSRSLRG